MDLSKFLADAASNWDETVKKAKESSYAEVPDGVYIVQLSSAEISESKAGNPQIKWNFTILEDELVGQTKTDFMALNGKLGLDPLAWRLSALGFHLEEVNLQKLPEFLEGLVEANMVMRIKLTTKPGSDFQNMRVMKLLPDYEREDLPVTSTEPVEEELRIGMKIDFLRDGKVTRGEVKEINDDETEVKVSVGKEKDPTTVLVADIQGIAPEDNDA